MERQGGVGGGGNVRGGEGQEGRRPAWMESGGAGAHSQAPCTPLPSPGSPSSTAGPTLNQGSTEGA